VDPGDEEERGVVPKKASMVVGWVGAFACLSSEPRIEAWNGHVDELDGLTRAQAGRSMRVSSSDPDWQSGNQDARLLRPGATLTIADIDGPGVIRHIWFTINAKDPRYGRSLTLRMYWDNREEPAVESPIGDFFAVGHGARRCVDSLPVAVTSEGRAFNCYWSMPFERHARITLSNDSKAYTAKSVYWYVDYEKVAELPPDALRFHAQYRQEFPAKLGQNYLILDAEGRGHYVGTVLSVYCRTRNWFGEGDDFFYIDGETEPSLRGTGTEDYFCDAWGFREFNRPYYGVVQFDGYEVGDRVSVYRWHIKDPVRFAKSLKVEIEHKGTMYDETGGRVSGFQERADLFSSVAFWYQAGKAKRFATLPPAEERVVPVTSFEIEACAASAKPSPPDTKLEAYPSTMFSDRQQLQARFGDEKSSLVVPFTVSAATRGIARLRLGASPDSGVWSVALDGKPVGNSVDLYSAALAVREIRIGMVDLDAGEHELTFECRGRNPASLGYFIGVDVLSIAEMTTFAVPVASRFRRDNGDVDRIQRGQP